MPSVSRWPRLSLTQRLTVFFSVVAAMVVFGLGLLFLIATERHFVALDQMALRDKQQSIEKILHTAPSADAARLRLGEVLADHEGLVAQVHTVSGVTIFKSDGAPPGMDNADAVAPPPAGVAGRWRQGGRLFQVRDFSTAAPFSGAPLQVRIALDTDVHRHFLHDLRRSLFAYTLVALLLCGLLSWWAARRGLAPLREMKARAARVSGQQLDARMPVEAVPVEMADLAQALNRMLTRLQDDFRRLTDFSADLAHELRTPISNLLTQTQVVLAYPRETATYRDTLASNVEELERLARIVSDMLLLAKTERGVDLPRMERFPARQEAQALLEFYEAVADEKHVRLHLEGDGDIEGDRLMFRRALSNLLSNAVRHTPEAGVITIHITAAAQATTVAVENTGADIDPKILPRLFDRFYRADQSRAHPDSDGSGLGLAITRAIAQAHGGSVTASSQDGLTCFKLVLPRYATKPSS